MQSLQKFFGEKRITTGFFLHQQRQGGSGVNIAPPNSYMSLKTGVIDGMVMAWSSMGVYKLWEVADYVNEVTFGATTTPAGALYAASPTAFGFLDNTPASITIGSTTKDKPWLDVPADKEMSIVAGDLTIKNSVLVAGSGQINLVSVGSAGDVGISSGSAPDTSDFATMGTMTISIHRIIIFINCIPSIYDFPLKIWMVIIYTGIK